MLPKRTIRTLSDSFHSILQRLFPLLLLTLSCGSGLIAQGGPPTATSLAYEPFAYAETNRSLGSLGGGTGFAGTWRHTLRGSSGSGVRPQPKREPLQYPDLLVSGGSCQVGASDAMQVSQRRIPDALSSTLTNGSVVYLSFLLRPEGTLNEGILNGYFVAGLVGDHGDVFAGKPGGDRMDRYVVEQSGGGGQAVSEVAPKIGETALLVLKVEFREGPEKATLFVNPKPGESEPATGVTKEDVDLGNLDFVMLYSTGAHSVDEVRLGTSFASVVPRVGASR